MKPAGSQFRAVRGIAERPIDDELFLVDTRANTVHRLNAGAAVVWRLLPRSETAIGQLMQAAFPDVEPGRIAGDLRAALDDLEEMGLIERKPIAAAAERSRNTKRRSRK